MNKKIFIITILILVLLLSACSLNNVEDTELVDYTLEEVEEDILTKLKKEYPNATITEENGKYSVISDNIDFETVAEKSQHGMSDRHIYTSMNELLDSINPIWNAVFIGRKTGETKQYIPINSKGQVDGLYYTNSKVEVQKVFYGDISEGDIITLKEFYAVFGSDEKEKLLYMGDMPISNDECFYVVTKREKESLFGDDCFYDPRIDGCFKIETVKNNIESGKNIEGGKSIPQELYTKYIVNGDTAIDKEAEIAKAKKWLGETPITEKQLAKIDELCKKYGEVKK